MELSFFKGFTDTLPESITLDALVALMRTDESVRDYTEKHRYYRDLGNTPSAKYYKNRMPCFGVAARFAGGKRKEHITALTGLSLVDIDHIAPDQMTTVLEKVRADEHTLLAYTTLSGQGVRVLFRYAFNDNVNVNENYHPEGDSRSLNDNENENQLGRQTLPLRSSSTSSSSFYKTAFLQCNEYYSTLTGLDTDLQCKNVGRLSTIAHDKNLYYNPEAVPFVIQPEEKRPVGRPRKRVEGLGLRVAFPLTSAPLKVRQRTPFERCKVGDVEATILRELERRGIVYAPGNHNKYISDACYMMNRYGVPEEECTAWALERFADYQADGNDVAAIVRSCYQQTAEHGTAQPPRTTIPYATIEQIRQYLIEQGVHIRHNVVTRKEEIRVDENEDFNEDDNENEDDNDNDNENRIQVPIKKATTKSSLSSSSKWNELEEKVVNSLHCRFCIDTRLRLHSNDLYIVIGSDLYPNYNPFVDYLQRLPPWDGTTDHIGLLASRVHVAGGAQALHDRCLRKWLVAMLATWLYDDVVNHEILTYIGRQGIYKSSFMRELLPPELRRYFSTRNFAQRMDKDARFELSEVGLVCLEELDHMKTAEINQLKAIVTETHINERASYGRYKERRAHIASFCGTGNNPRFLSDPTGNRRWMPFVVDRIVSPYTHPFDYVGIYSQAYALLQQGFVYWFTEEDNAELDRHNQHFEEPSIEEELIMTYLAQPYGNYTGEFLTATRIIELVGSSIRQSLSPRRIAFAMNNLGFAPRRLGNLRGWVAVILTGDQIKADQRSNAVNSQVEG